MFKLFHFIKPYWRRAVAALILLTSLVIMDLTIPRLVQTIIDQGIYQHSQDVVIRTSIIMLAISLLSTLIAVGNNITSVQVAESVGRDLRDAIFTHIQSFSYGNLDQMKTGQLLVRLTSDSGAVQRVFQISLRIGTRAPLMMIGSLILMFNTSPQLALKLVPLLIVTSIVIVFFVSRMEPLFLRVQQRLDRLNNVLQENISGAHVVKAFVRADFENQRFESANEGFTDTSVRVMRFMSTMSPALTVFVNIGMVGVIYFGGLQAISGTMTVGQIVAFINYLITTMTPLTMMTMLSQTWANGIASAKRINQVLDMIPLVQDQPDAIEMPVNNPGRVVFENVGFHYNGASDEPVLNKVDIVAEPGQTVAILGATGSGKTSLINLIPRFYDVSSGRVTIDGIDIRQLQQDSLLADIGVVPQESLLFSGSVKDNIRYGRPDASDDEVISAAKAAQAHDFILELSQGYDTHVEQRGANFSGGQKQRLAIARALLLKPRVLILDDSTSSVDVETETLIQDALADQQFNHTTFVVAQRISTVLNANKIIVMDEGQVVAQGTHKELLKSSQIYQEIYESQLGKGIQVAQDDPIVSQGVS
ncbi:MAG: multidrug ABC transporter ATP-binding protein [Chloroflexi bacterium RBG_13_48_10]|nr:MAG: multidrug ABC transporter ATP-binding protein [Chloroflexi bacterium RBG_13_48_10]